MDIPSYLAASGVTQSELAARVGVAPSTLSRISRGLRDPGAGLQRRIYAATFGAVTPADLLGLDADTPASSAEPAASLKLKLKESPSDSRDSGPSAGSALDAGETADPVAAVRALRERIVDLMGESPVDWAAVERLQGESLAIALRLRPDGRLASPAALCAALGADRHVYDDVVRRYAGAEPGRRPRKGSRSEQMLRALVESGDARFAAARRRAAA